MVRKAIVATLLVALSAGAALADDEKPEGALSGAALKKLFSGYSIWDHTPSGNIFQIKFLPDGQMTGKTHKDGDKGKWWVKGDTLCRNWTIWAPRPGKEEACFYVTIEEGNVVYYQTNGDFYREWRPWPGQGKPLPQKRKG